MAKLYLGSQIMTPAMVVAGEKTYILINSTAGATLTCGTQSYTLGSSETYHIFVVSVGTHTCTASLTGYGSTTKEVTVTTSGIEVTIKPSLLPNIYQQVEYLEGTTTDKQYIKTGLVYSNFDTMSGKYYVFDRSGGYIMGSQQGSNRFYLYSTTTRDGLYLGSVEAPFTTSYGIENEFKAVFTSGIATVTYNGITNAYTCSSSSFSSLELYLFANNYQGSLDTYKRHRWMELYFHQGDTLVRSFIPCYLKSDSSVRGMYDAVSGTLYQNQGSGSDFVLGPDV